VKYRVIFNPEARTDLLNLYRYIADRSEKHGDSPISSVLKRHVSASKLFLGVAND